VGADAATQLPITGLNDPHGLAVDAEHNIYITDRGNAGAVQLRSGTTAAIPLPFIGLNDPQGVAVDGAGNIYIADTGTTPVVKLLAE
jgi:serine/threonine-protein kinase